jgi:hypothetical protein
MTLEEMQDAIASKSKPARETVMAMYGGVMPRYATLARRENFARINGKQEPKRQEPHRTRQDGDTSIARAIQQARQMDMSKARTEIITDLLKTPKTLKQIVGLTDIPISSAMKLLEQMLNDGKVSRVRHHHGAIWSMEAE